MPPKIILSKKDQDEIIELYLSGMSSGEIYDSGKFNISKPTILRFLSSKNVTIRDPKQASKLRSERGRAHISSYWKGKEFSKEHKENISKAITGKKNPRYVDGKQSNLYRKGIKKIQCKECESKKNLCIHHIDFDHFNNNPDNLEVICVSCHMSLHKKMYWDSIKKGEKPMKSNGIIGWKR